MFRPVSEGIHRAVIVNARPAEVFAYMHDPDSRAHWDRMADLMRYEADAPAKGVRVHFRGRRTAPSWVGEFVEYDPPRRSVIRLVEGVGMPFRDFRQTIIVAKSGDGSRVEMDIDYEARGVMRLLEAMTARPRMAKAVTRSLNAVAGHFG